MKKLMFLFGIVISMQAVAQIPTPNFMFRLKATNALGHKDSAMIGTYQGSVPVYPNVDPIAGFDGPNIINTPSDSNIELRVAYMGHQGRYSRFKKRIVPSFCSVLNLTSPLDPAFEILVTITAKKWPVTLSWDSTLFALDSCVAKSFFTKSYIGLAYYPPFIDLQTYPNPMRFCAEHKRLVLDSMVPPDDVHQWLSVRYANQSNVTLTNGKVGKMYSLSLYLNKSLGINTNDPPPASNQNAQKRLPLHLYPNPATDQLTIEQPEVRIAFVNLKIYTMQGKTVQQQLLAQGSKSHVIGVSGLQAGMYLIEIKDKEGRMYREKFVKR